MTSKVVLISGANKGIGKEAAKQLGKKGFKVYLGCRDMKRGEEAAKELRADSSDVEAIHLDVTNQDSIDNAISSLSKKHGHLDVLINNAGILLDRGTEISTTDLDDVEKTMQTNFFGPLRLIKAAQPLLEKSSAGKIINVSSTLGSLTKASDPTSPFAEFTYVGYNCSKAALNMLTLSAASTLGKKGIKVNSICPGYVATDINDNKGFKTVEQGAAIIVKMASTDENGPTGEFFNDEGTVPW